MMNTIAFIQARMSSTRYPGKVLVDLAGIPMILFMIQRVKRARMIDKVILLTSTDSSDEELADCAGKAGELVFRGSLEDVLDRFASAAQTYPAQNYVRLTGDCPFSDPKLIDSIINLHLRSSADYTCNTNPPTYPDGLDVEVFTAKALSDATKSALRPSEREHVTAWMYNSKNDLHCENFAGAFDASHLRLTIDYPDDAEAVKRIISALDEPVSADYFDILRAIASDPSIRLLNQHTRNENFLN